MPEEAKRTEEAYRLHRIERLLRIQVPQVWTMEMLREHYPAWSDREIKAAAAKHAGYRGTRGRPFSLTVHQVERIDAAIEAGE